ncbi:spirocyclase AveC family protein [Streptomyces sp. cg36]|uniref:spirocyclase AveC family protein n=1 Tax=Streptomyces sp. cg36 TaxID=3238798 RepID=UPI0034E25678
MLWAAGGAVALGLQAAVFARWIAAGDIHAAPRDFAVPTYRAALIWTEQALGLLLVAACIAVAIVQSRRERNVSWTAAIVIGSAFTFWLGFLSCWDRQYAAGNRYALNVTSWAPYVPGWHGPHPERQIDTLFAAQTFMYIGIIYWAWVQQLLLRYVFRCTPHSRMPRIVLSLLLSGLLADVLIEGVLLSGMGGYAYLTANRSWAVFGGHWYQLPLVNVAIGGITLACMPTAMQWSAERRGRTAHIFRGEERFTDRTRPWLRALAGIGFMNVVVAAYWILTPLLVTASGPDPLPPDTPAWLWSLH